MSMPAQVGLPHEVLTAVLEHLPQKELRNASQVSRRFYSSAHDAGLTLHQTVNTDESKTLDTFARIVKHAEAQPQRFRLALSLIVYRRTGESDSDGLPSWDDIWTTVRRAMPFLVSLHIILDSDVMQDVFAALDAPAPYLRAFTVETIDMDGRFPSVQPPASFFGGSAPRLRGVELTGPALLPTGTPVPAWRAVRALKMLSSVPGQAVDVARFFPALRELVLVVLHSRENVPHVVDLSGLTLDTFTLINDAEAPIQYTAAPARVGVLKDISPAARYDATLWPDEGDLTARMYQESNACAQHRCEVLSVSSGASRYEHYAKPDAARETYWQRYAFDALTALPPLLTHLVSLTIDDAMLARLRTDSTLAALRELYVACTARPPPAPQSTRCKNSSSAQSVPKIGRVSLRCPALARITMFATTAVSVGRERIAPLGALRPAERKSVLLVLARVSVNYDNMDGPLLRDVFSKVRVVEEDCAPAHYYQCEENARCDNGV